MDQSKLAVVGSQLNSIVGPALTPATNIIVITSRVHHVTGTSAIATITPPYPDFQGEVILIPDGIFTCNTSGNISLATTAVVNKALTMTYDGSKWAPSY